MKKISVLLVLLCMLVLNIRTTFAQGKNSIYAAFIPCDLGLGLRYDYKYLYISGTVGKFWLGNIGYIKNQKLVLGGIYYFKPNPQGIFFANIGVSYHQYQKHLEINALSPRTFDPFSCEAGVGWKFFNGFSTGFSFDPLKTEGTMYFGFSF